MAPGQLKPWAKNPRKNDPAVVRVAESIRQFGFANPVLARKENSEIIAGHTRWKAAQLLGLKSIPVRFLDLDEDKAHLLALADNKLGELASWDDEQLASLLKDMSIGEAQLAGWEAEDLGKLLDMDLPDGGEPALQDGLTYSVVVECENEEQQTELLERFESEGLNAKPLVLLYLCADDAEMQPTRDIKRRHERPELKRGRDGAPYQPPAKIEVWETGFQIGQALRDARATSAGAGGSVRGHIRKSHWHSYWLGSGENKRRELRWLSPILVNLREPQAPTVRRVKEDD